MNKRTVGILILVGVIFLILIGLTVYLVQQQQDVRSHASTPPIAFNAGNLDSTLTPTTAPTAGAATVTPTTACTTPAAVTKVQIDYPYQDTSGKVHYTEANCTWTAVTGSSSYSVKITNSDTSTIVTTTTVGSTATNIVFPVNQGSKYKCEVSATNACSTGAVGSIEATCQVDGIVTTTTAPTPPTTSVPTATPIVALPTPTPLPPIQNLPKAGSVGTTLAIGIVGTLLVLTGGALLFGL